VAAEPLASGPRPWHALSVEEVAAALATDPERGLAAAEARRRLARVGANRVADTGETPLWRLALRQFRSLVVLLLLVAAAIAWGLGEVAEALAILAALVLNAAIGFGTEWRAQISLARLRALVVPMARVRRDGRDLAVPAAGLVPGDVILLEAGSQVPADARLVRATALRVDESALTGESVPVAKIAPGRLPADTRLAERTSMVYLATAVLAGSGTALVTATGLGTELGRIGQLVALAGERTTPLERQVERLGRRMIGLALGVCALVAAIGILHGEPVGLMLETAVSLAISAIPEGLPAVTAVALATGLWRLARAGALVRRLPAVETLGSTTVICADKTGTMTENRMTVVRLVVGERAIEVHGEGDAARGAFREGGRDLDPAADAAIARLLTVGSLVNDAALEVEGDRLRGHGDPTETALLVAAAKAGIDPAALARQWPRRREIPFDPLARYMATFHETPDGGRALLVKGAPGEIVRRSSWRETAAGPVALSEGDRAHLLAVNRELAAGGVRVLALAWRPDGWGDGASPEGLTFLGFAGLADPVRAGVKDAIGRCAAAGIRTLMLTGDQRSTAEAVGRELGIPPDAIRSRVSPEEKLELVRGLQQAGEIVAMTGDGVNDAPALARADIGIAMGRHGTDVARDAADLVLTDDNFTTIAAAVQEGRVIYANLRKVIHFLFSCNLSEILTILVAVILGLPAPLLPLQILWVNLVTDILPAMALIRDPAAPDVMRRAPRAAGEAIVTRAFGARILGEAGLLAAGVLSAHAWVLAQEGPSPRASTMAFLAMVLVHPLQAQYCRSGWLPVWRLPRNALIPVSMGALAAVQWVAITWPPLAGLLGAVPLSGTDWLIAVGACLWPVAVLEAAKAVRRGAMGRGATRITMSPR
jgi:Ca2+-transporting ATPase